MQETLVILKPDCVARRLDYLFTFALKKYCSARIVESIPLTLTPDVCRTHYAAHVDKDFYPELEDFMCSSTSVVLRVRGNIEDIRETALVLRELWRYEYAPKSQNLIHASDSVEAAQREIELWFGAQEEDEA